MTCKKFVDIGFLPIKIIYESLETSILTQIKFSAISDVARTPANIFFILGKLSKVFFKLLF